MGSVVRILQDGGDNLRGHASEEAEEELEEEESTANKPAASA